MIIIANLILAFHIAYVAFIVLGQLLILVGILCRWHWVRNRVFRLCHLAAILIVVVEAAYGIQCPLTVWEHNLRILAGQTQIEMSFVGQIVHSLLFFDLPAWVLRMCHILFGILVAITFFTAPPCLKTAHSRKTKAA